MDWPRALEGILDGVEGGLAALLGTPDGLLVEAVARRRPGLGRAYLEAALAEHVALFQKLRAAYAETLGEPDLEEVWARGQGLMGYLRRLPGGLFLLLIMGPGANLGRARLEAGRLVQALDKEGVWPTSRP